MDFKARILAFAGSARTDSLNKKVVKVAADGARETGAEVTVVDLRDYPMPIYDGDLEQHDGIPENAGKLRTLMNDHHGFLIASPEYNGSITPLLKNVLDWVSRPVPDGSNHTAYADKVVGLMSASPGFLGGMRSLMHARWVLSKLGALVLPDQSTVGQAGKAFDSDGNMTDERKRDQLMALGRKVVETTAKLNRP